MKMKKHKPYIPLLLFVLCLSACIEDNERSSELFPVTITLSDPIENAEVQLRSSAIYTAKTDQSGVAVFSVPAGVYEVSTSGFYVEDGQKMIYNAVLGQLGIGHGQQNEATLTVKKSEGGAVLLIKELYNGGVMLDNNSANFLMDKCVVLYNNSSEPYTAEHLCIGMVAYYNAEANTQSKLYGEDGKLVYEDSHFTPAINGIWYFPNALTIEPYSQIVVNICGAIDNTQTVSNSINYANKDYYCMYDPTYVTSDVTSANAVSYNNTSYYPAPAAVIPTSHYLKTVKYGQGNAWPFSGTSPAIFIFQTKDITPTAYFEDAANYWYIPGYATTPIWRCAQVPNKWIIDGLEVFAKTKLAECRKRFTADIDAGFVALTNQLGHSLYRNVDKEATEALEENQGKLVYDYALGVDTSTDPSGIDAEASIRNGAHIVFMDTNNSTNDFHERQKCSLRH